MSTPKLVIKRSEAPVNVNVHEVPGPFGQQAENDEQENKMKDIYGQVGDCPNCGGIHYGSKECPYTPEVGAVLRDRDHTLDPAPGRENLCPVELGNQELGTVSCMLPKNFPHNYHVGVSPRRGWMVVFCDPDMSLTPILTERNIIGFAQQSA